MNLRIEQLKKFLEQSRDDPFLKYALAIEYVNLNDDETALTFFQDLISSSPDYAATYYHLGKLFERANKKDSAEQTYREGMKRTFGKDQHTHRELQEALNALMFEE